ncbi:ATP-binding protein [Streptomyces sp. NBC_01803]|uniref:ATP-binding protein n=1 Tax=Streptomyces sp. NBC_01803 TaxID=2975946 RepID=UPI002DDC5DCC|nr:ATP-binding protein [Streptomyces sp. NBC_01803]WSA43594.1 ATP-binding protein [Streptomyces sp. NBC_01803]
MELPSPAYDVALDLPEDGGSAAHAREFARRTLIRHEYRGRHEDVVLVVSELVSNALRHGHGAPVLRMVGTPGRVRVEVSDDSPARPVPRAPGPAGGGLGLRMIDRLAADWGSSPLARGKVVWCELTSADQEGSVGGRPVPGTGSVV